jgi:DNA modification methylase
MSGHDAKALLDSIGKFGDMGGVVFNRRSSRLVGGHQRREIFIKKSGKVEITETLDEPNEVGTVARGYIVIGTERFSYRVVDWDETKEKLANLAANRIQGDWDDDKLAQLIYSLRDDAQLPDTGFTINEVNEILATVMDVGEDDADLTPPAPESVITKPGDMWQLGDHRLLCGDATHAASYDALMDGQEAEMVFTDPPYNVAYTGGMGGDGKQHRRKAIKNDKMEAQQFYNFMFDVCKELLRNCRGAFYICMSSSELHTLHRAFTENGGHWQTYIIWAKNTFTLSRSDYQHQYEPIMYGLSEEEAAAADSAPDSQLSATPILYGWKDKHSWYGGRKQGDVWLIDRPSKSPEHPTMKPVTLCARAIRNSSHRRKIVLDPFLGSGSTLVAAEQLQRICYGMELEPAYCDVIIRRWEHLTGKKATLIKNIGGTE